MSVEIIIDYNNCTSCKKCVELCDYGTLEWFEEQPIVANPSSCSYCLKCMQNCPVNAIIIKK
jgi:NAD-dependent dihydropyrimidine dehydrogenase PreA subunit